MSGPEQPRCERCAAAPCRCKVFDNAAFYDCEDRNPENLVHDTPEDAIADFLEWRNGFDGEQGMIETIRGLESLTVEAYQPRPLDEKWIDNAAESLAERLQDDWAEDFGDPDGDHQIEPDVDALREVVRKAVEGVHVWQCEVVASRTYTVEEVEAMMRAHAPEWFEVTRG